MTVSVYSRLKENRLFKKVIRPCVPASVRFMLNFFFDRGEYYTKYRKYHSLFRVPESYVDRIAPNLAFYFSWLFWPIYFAAKKARLVFLINNISYSPGHVATELDWFFHRLHTKELLSDRRYVVVWPRSEVAHGAAEAFRDRFYAFILSDFLYCLLLPLIMRYPDITVDCGLSPINHPIIENGRLRYVPRPIMRHTPRPYAEVLNRLAFYFKLRHQTHGLCSTKPDYSMSSELADFLGVTAEKYAVIQIRTYMRNASAASTDPSTYLEALNFLRENGYGLVFAGRETMPQVFHSMGILNYAGWHKADFFHDLQLIADSRFVLSSGSGFAMLADTMEIPLVYSNSWHLACPSPSPFCVTVPTLLHGEDGNLLRFRGQIGYFLNKTESSTPPPASMKPRIATSREILEATKEALALGKCFQDKSDLQKQFGSLQPDIPLFFADSRISQYFIEKFQDLLN